MVLSNVVFVVTVLSSSSVFGQACVQVSARLANVSCGSVAAFDLVFETANMFSAENLPQFLGLLSDGHKRV